MTDQMDLVTVCFADELKLLQLQARSVRLYMEALSLGRIHLVVNDNNFRHIKSFIETEVLPEYGAFADKVSIVDYRSLSNKRFKKPGWRSQQLLKLMASGLVNTDQYLILDCKNHFIRPFGCQTFLRSDGHLKIEFKKPQQRYLRDFLNARTHFDLPSPDLEVLGLPMVTPFPLHTRLVRQMIEMLETRQSKTFEQIFMKGPRVTEFYLYYAFLEAVHGGIEAFYVHRPRASFSLMASAVEDPDRAIATTHKLKAEDVFGFGVHRRVIADANPDILAAVISVWQQYGLVDSEEEALFFLKPAQLEAKRMCWFF